jgi:hypothetical protein
MKKRNNRFKSHNPPPPILPSSRWSAQREFGFSHGIVLFLSIIA